MTGTADTTNASVAILIDGWEDGIVEDRAWVKVTTLTQTADEALAFLERSYPANEQGEGGEGMHYIAHGKVKLRPLGWPDADGIIRVDGPPGQQHTFHWPEVPWHKSDEPDAQEFWEFEVTCDG